MANLIIEDFDEVTGVLRRRRVQHPGGGESRVKQAEARATDINVIVEKWRRDGTLPREMGGRPTYGDFSQGGDFQTTLNRLHAAEAEFMSLPAKVRSLCENDPSKFLDLVHEPSGEGLKHLVEAGFAPELAPASAGEALASLEASGADKVPPEKVRESEQSPKEPSGE